MIYHINRMRTRADATPQQIEEALEVLREQGRVIPSVRSFTVGRHAGGEFDWGAVFVIADLDGYWEYLTHPAHLRSMRVGVQVCDRFEFSDVSDAGPELGTRIDALQRRLLEQHPEAAAVVALR